MNWGPEKKQIREWEFVAQNAEKRWTKVITTTWLVNCVPIGKAHHQEITTFPAVGLFRPSFCGLCSGSFHVNNTQDGKLEMSGLAASYQGVNRQLCG